MPRRRSLTSQPYRAARISNDLEVAASGNPKRAERRAKNVMVGRALRAGRRLEEIVEVMTVRKVI